MIEIRDQGKARAVGVSNFQVPDLERIIAETGVTPAANQIEVHPYLTNETVRAFNREHGIATEAWSPIAQGLVLDDPTLQEIASRVGRTTAQVALRWHVQRGDIVFPKSVTRSRVEENFALFDFELTEADVEAISALNRDHRTGRTPTCSTGCDPRESMNAPHARCESSRAGGPARAVRGARPAPVRPLPRPAVAVRGASREARS